MATTSRCLSWFGKTLLAGSLVCSVPFAEAEADLIAYPLIIAPGFFCGNPETCPPPYGTVTVDRSDDFNAHITFTGGSSGGLNYYIVGRFLGEVQGNTGDDGNVAVAVFANVPLLGEQSIAAGNVDVTPAPGNSIGIFDTFDSFGLGEFLFGTARGPMVAGATSTRPNFLPALVMQSISFDILSLSQSWASASEVLTPNPNGFLAAASIIACAADVGCEGDLGLAGTSVVNGPAFAPVPVPEPASLVLLCAGLLALLACRRALPGTAGKPEGYR